MHGPPAYAVRVSPRARHVHLKLSWQGELEVVVPRGYSRRHIPKVIAAKSAWLERARARMHEQLSALPCEFFEQRPARVRLQALSRTYKVHYESASGTRVRIERRSGVTGAWPSCRRHSLRTSFARLASGDGAPNVNALVAADERGLEPAVHHSGDP